ncbi:Translation initiation factor eIF-2B subunit alpha [Nymphaea thermarum]|nr:Translation initiation factor eIF-2B subunit alpha [Nymphaea thermarum]
MKDVLKMLLDATNGIDIMSQSWDTASISLTAACDLFMRYVTRTTALDQMVSLKGLKFGEISLKERRTIAMLSQDFIFDGCTILVHGFSRVVLEVLKMAAGNGKIFRVFCTEGRPDKTGLRFAEEMVTLEVPVKLLIDSAVAYTMDEVDVVLFGADGVVESGGIINMMGTYQTALVARSMSKPVYVAAESYKFARLYPLDQKDLSPALRPIDFGVPVLHQLRLSHLQETIHLLNTSLFCSQIWACSHPLLWAMI